MDFVSERDVMNKLSEAVCKASVNMFYSIKYIYSIAKRDFYTEDAARVVCSSLKDVFDCSVLRGSGVKISPKVWDELDTPGFERLPCIIAYSFAVRLPVLQKVEPPRRKPMDKKQLLRLYETCFFKGAESASHIEETFQDNLRLMKKQGRLDEYSHEWLISYLADLCPGFDELSNENLFFIGALSVYMPMFWDKLESELERIVRENAIS